MNDTTKENFLNLLYEILLSEPEGIKEFALLKILQEKNVVLFQNQKLHDPLVLFRTHFLLFHFLYLLQDRLRLEKTAELEIHCLKIALSPPIENANTLLPDHADPLREYYLDLTQLEQVEKEDVTTMIDQFWEKYSRFDKRGEALALLDLKDPITDNEIKRKYRQLVLEHHPDQGGKPEQFHRIVAAMEILMG